MNKFEIKLTDDELEKAFSAIDQKYPRLTYKFIVAIRVFGNASKWNIRKVREAVSRLQSKGYPIIAHHGGYSVFGDDPQPVIEYLNREYHRVYEAQKKNDQIFHALKQKYGDSVAAKIEQMPGQPMLEKMIIRQASDNEMIASIPFHKTYDKDGTMHNV